jgi:hypothetical protein
LGAHRGPPHSPGKTWRRTAKWLEMLVFNPQLSSIKPYVTKVDLFFLLSSVAKTFTRYAVAHAHTVARVGLICWRRTRLAAEKKGGLRGVCLREKAGSYWGLGPPPLPPVTVQAFW